MSREEIFEKVRDIMAETADLEPEDIRPEKNLMNELDLTSMDVMAMITEFENAFAIKIPEEALRGFLTVQDIVACIAGKTGAEE